MSVSYTCLSQSRCSQDRDGNREPKIPKEKVDFVLPCHDGVYVLAIA
jgi:hypothetical protein